MGGSKEVGGKAGSKDVARKDMAMGQGAHVQWPGKGRGDASQYGVRMPGPTRRAGARRASCCIPLIIGTIARCWIAEGFSSP